MHRNTFLNSPKLLNANQSLKSDSRIFFAGQITGVEGYMESAASGITAAINVIRYLKNESPAVFSEKTMLGAFQRYISDSYLSDFQPMGASFGLLPKLDENIRDKKERNEKLAERSLSVLEEEKSNLDISF